MDSDFLKAAERGRSHFKDYALALLFIVLGLLGLIFIFSLVVVIYRVVFGLPLEEFSFTELSCSTKLVFAIGVYVALAFIIFLTTFKIHKRHPRTLINTGQNIRVKRILFGFTAWLLIRAFSSFVLSLIYPKRYSFNGFSEIDIYVALLGLILCFLASLLGAVLVAYILQGLNHLVKDLLLSIVYFIVSIAAILIFSTNNFQVLFFLLGIFNFLFFILMMLKEKGIELNIGWLMANGFYVNFCVSSKIEGGNPLLAECPSFVVAGSLPEIVGFLVSIAQIGIFYYVFLVDRDRSQTGAN